MRLDHLPIGRQARITAIDDAPMAMMVKLREIGFAEDDLVKIVHFGPINKTPLCIQLNQTLVALRRAEAAMIRVDPLS